MSYVREGFVVKGTCFKCGAYAERKWDNVKKTIERRGRFYCSLKCGVSQSMIDNPELRKRHSERMSNRATNPMADPTNLAKMKESRLKHGTWAPKERHGNGSVMPEPQRLLSEALQWPTEVVVSTKRRADGYPHCYKIDIADTKTMIAIEIDGGSHGSRKVQIADAKKSQFLASLGWQVIRFRNKYVLTNLTECVKKVQELRNASQTVPN